MTALANRHDETASISETIGALSEALWAKDAAAVRAQHADDMTLFSLAPPLVAPRDGAAELQSWFETWEGPIGYDVSKLDIRHSGDLAMAYGLARMHGTKTDGTGADLWFRVTICLARVGAEWKIVHMHESVPFYMDGSFRAAVDLAP